MRSLLLTFVVLSSNLFFAQQIDSIRVFPSEPYDIDSIEIYVYSTFPYSNCAGTSDFSISGNNIYSSSIHCLGIQPAFCHDIDTFKLGRLTIGNYYFFHSLSSGIGPVPCTPGIIVDDIDTLNFLVEHSLSIKKQTNNEFILFPNPIKDEGNLKISSPTNLIESIHIYDLTLRKIKSFSFTPNKNQEFDLNGLKKGTYLLEFIDEYGVSSKLFKILKE